MIFILRPSKNNLHICPVSAFFKTILIIPFPDFEYFKEKLSKIELLFQRIPNGFRMLIFFNRQSLHIDLRGFDVAMTKCLLSFRH